MGPPGQRGIKVGVYILQVSQCNFKRFFFPGRLLMFYFCSRELLESRDRKDTREDKVKGYV